MAAEPIHGCSTMPKGMKTPAWVGGRDNTHRAARREQGEGPPRSAQQSLGARCQRAPACSPLKQAISELGSGGAVEGTGVSHRPAFPITSFRGNSRRAVHLRNQRGSSRPGEPAVPRHRGVCVSTQRAHC